MGCNIARSCRAYRALKDRLRAVFLYALLVSFALSMVGCAAVRTSILDMQSNMPVESQSDISEQAANIRFASIKLEVDGTGGLLLLAEQAPRATYWATGQKQVVVLKLGHLYTTIGLNQDLVVSRYDPPLNTFNGPEAEGESSQQAISHTHQLLRTWTTGDGREITGRGRASIACEAGTQRVELPLVTLPLEKCQEDVAWNSGEQTHSVYWRDPKTHRIWAANTVAWPGAPEINWEVARPWW